MRATPISAPLKTAHASASGHEVSGCSGLAGGGLPVAAFHPVVRIFLAAMPDSTAPPVPRTFHGRALMGVSLPQSTLPSQRTTDTAGRLSPGAVMASSPAT